jgi:hypothetical protein
MNRIILSLALVTLLCASCTKKDDFTFNTDLALDSRFIILNAPADTTKIVVYSDHNWTIENRDNASWITVQKGSGNGTAYAIVSVTDNPSDYPRASTLLFKSGSKTDTLKLGQRGLITPTIAIKATTVSAAAAGATISTAITATLPLNVMDVSYSGDGSSWISGLAIANNNLTFNVAANPTSAARSSKIYLSYLDILGTTAKDSLTVNQLKP